MELRRLPPCAKASRRKWAHTDPSPPRGRATRLQRSYQNHNKTLNSQISNNKLPSHQNKQHTFGLHRVADPSKPKQQTLQITNNQTTSILKQQTFKYLTKQTNVCARSACTACLCDCRFCNGREEHLQEEDTSTVQCDD